MAKSSFYSGSQQVSANSNAVEDSKNAAALSEAAAAASAAASATSAASGAASATTATTKASESAASATASATSASASQASRLASEAAKVASEAAKTAAETARDAAAASSTSASSSQAAASTSETNAATSAAAALVSENAAAASAATATTEASDSATSAAASEVSNVASGVAKVAAETAETNAATSETNAATSETNAATSETNAATSETNAATSATAAASSASSASTSATSASNAQTAAESARDATLAAYDNFDDRYLGSKASDPTVDNDGNALVAGSLYFDTVSGAMRVYTGSAWVAAYVNGADYLALSGGTMTGDVAYGDNVKATFGASADLQIYHNGSQSLIEDVGTGGLFLRGDGTVWIQNQAGTETKAEFVSNGKVGLYYNNAEKLATTSTGINVTGTVVADGLTVDGNVLATDASNNRVGINQSSPSTDLQISHPANNAATLTPSVVENLGLRVKSESASNTTGHIYSGISLGEGYAGIYGYDGGASAATGLGVFTGTNADVDKRITVDANGDISFYEDTGTTEKFFWDASNESLGIGTTSPSSTFAVDSTKPFRILSTNPNVNFVESDVSNQSWAAGSYGGTFAVRDITGSGYPLQIEAGTSSNTLYLDSTDRVGIGTSSPSRKLTVEGGSGDTLPVRVIGGSGTTTSGIEFQDPSTTADYKVQIGSIGDNLYLRAGGAEVVRITSSGNLQMTAGGAVDFGDWTITESGGSLYFATGGTNKMKLDASGNLDVVGSVNSNATIS